MKIIVSEYNGFCGGVKAAVLRADKILTEEKKLYCFGEIIHNNDVVEKLNEKGMITIYDLPEDNDAKLLIRSHGVGKNIYDKLEEKNILQEVGGRTYLAQLSNAVATAANTVNYANLIQKKATLRRLQISASEIMDLSFEEEREIDEVLDQAEKKIFGVSRKYLKNSFSSIDGLLNQAFERIDELHKRSGNLRGLSTGFYDLDNLLAGLQKSDLIILAARPSVGKTSLALDIV